MADGTTPLPRTEPTGPFRWAATWSSLLLTVWALVWPEPYLLVIGLLIAVPFAAMVAALASLARGGGDPARPRAILALGGFPAIALLVRTFDLQLLAWSWLPFLALGLVAIVMVFAGRFVPLGDPKRFGALLALSVGYIWGALCQLDVQLDFGQPVVHPVNVTRKWEGKRMNSLSWDGQDEPVYRAHIDQSFYDSVKVGDRICLLIYPGALGVGWYEAQYCLARYLVDRDISAEPAP